MGVFARGFKNVFRNNVRSFSIVLILAISMGMALIMLMSLKTVQSKIESVKSSIGNVITVSPAGMRGFEGSGTLLTTQNANDIKSLSNVSAVIETLSSRLTTIGSSTQSFGPEKTDSDAQTSLSAPPMKAPSDSGAPEQGRKRYVNGQDVTGNSNFSMPISAVGVNSLSNLSALQASSFSVTSGEQIDPASSDNVAMLGKELASQNNISAGGTFSAYGQTITVKGIFDAGNNFSNSMIIMPISTLQTLSGESDQVNSIIVTTTSVDSLSSVQQAIKDKLGDSVDVTTSEQSAESAIKPLENIKTISLYSLIGSLAAGAIIIFLTMVMIVRERRREIGVLKAIGASNAIVMSQFVAESLVITLVSSIVGMILGFALSNPVLKVLVSNSETSSRAAGNFGGGGGPMGRMMSFGANAGNAVRDLTATVGWDMILYGILAAIVIAVLGSALPSFIIAKVRPAEVLRSE